MSSYSNFIHNSQKLLTTQMSTNLKMDKQIVVYTYSRILLNNNVYVDTYSKMDESQKYADKSIYAIRVLKNLEQAKLSIVT